MGGYVFCSWFLGVSICGVRSWFGRMIRLWEWGEKGDGRNKVFGVWREI